MLFFWFLGLVCLSFTHVQANVIGIDMGGEFMKVSVVQPGAPLEIVTNFASKRKSETIVTFYRGERFYASDALGYVNRVPASAFQKITTTLGRDGNHPLVKRMSDEYLLQTVPEFNETRAGLTYLMSSQGPSGEEEIYTPEELVAMILSYARDITKAYGGSTVKDCVLTVPSYWTHMERQAYIDAAQLAGLKVLSLIEENTAAALQFGIDRVYENETTVLFYNMGATATQVTVATYSSYGGAKKNDKPTGQFVVRGKGWDANLGGHSVDLVLTNHIASEFNKIWSKDGSKDVRTVPRAMSKIRMQAKKVKEVLSANAEIPLWIASLHDDIDFNTHISRSQLENMCTDFFKQTIKPIQDALKAAELTVDDIDIIEMIGGGVRIPKVQETLKEFFGEEKELGIHMNGDEAMAVGASFRAANISTAFKVRKVGLGDVNPFAIDLFLQDLPQETSSGMFNRLWGSGDAKKEEDDEETWSKSSLIFGYNSKIDLKKKISFTHTEDIQVTLSYVEPGEGNPQLPEGTQPLIANYNVTGVAEFAKELADKGLPAPKVTLHFHLDASGLAQLSRAEATLEEEIVVIPETKPEKETDDEATTPEGDTADSADASDSKDSADSADEEGSEEAEGSAKDEEADSGKADAGEAGSEEGSDKGAEDGSSKKESQKKKKKSKDKKKKDETPSKQTKVHRKNLKVELSNHFFTLRSYTAEEIEESKNKLIELQRLDDIRHAKAEAKNNLEGYVLSLRSKFNEDDDLALVSTEEQREELISKAYELEDWLYDEGYDEDAEVYDEKRLELKEKADKIFYRAKEMKERPKAIKLALGVIEESRKHLEKWIEDKPQVTEEERSEALQKLEKVEKWIAEKQEEQQKLAPHEEPAFSAKQVDSKLKPATSFLQKLARKPKPEPPKKSANETASDGSSDSKNTTDPVQEGEDKSDSNNSTTEETNPTENDAGESSSTEEGSNKEEL